MGYRVPDRKALFQALAAAQAEYFSLLREQEELLAELPSGIPAADGLLRLDKISEARKLAFKKYLEAFQAANPSLKPLL